MSGASSSAAGWFSRLESARPVESLPRRPDDPRLGEVIEFWDGDPAALQVGRPVLIGFPQDEGIRRNLGRPGAAQAPQEVRRCLFRLTPFDLETGADLTARPLLDVGDVRITGTLEESQNALGIVVGAVLRAGAIPIVLGGGHETAFGHYLGYVENACAVGIINLDAHLDVRPFSNGGGHSGSPFRQAREHLTRPLPGSHYTCLGVQPSSMGREHHAYVVGSGGEVRWASEVRHRLVEHFVSARERLAASGARVYVSVDADVVRSADVPGVSAPNALGLAGAELIDLARLMGRSPQVSSFDLVELNPLFDRDGQSCRWGALVIWHFLAGVAGRAFPASA